MSKRAFFNPAWLACLGVAWLALPAMAAPTKVKVYVSVNHELQPGATVIAQGASSASQTQLASPAVFTLTEGKVSFAVSTKLNGSGVASVAIPTDGGLYHVMVSLVAGNTTARVFTEAEAVGDVFLTAALEMGQTNSGPASAAEMRLAIQPNFFSMPLVGNPSNAGGGCGDTTVTQNVDSSTIDVGASVSCNAGGLNTDNYYARAFDMTAFAGATLGCVDFGIESIVTGTAAATLSIYHDATGGAPSGPGAAGTLLASHSLTLDSTMDLTVVVEDFSADGVVIPAGGTIIVELFTPDGQTIGTGVFVGANAAGATAPTYLAADACGLPDYLDVAAIGFPDMHWVVRVDLNTGPPPPPACGVAGTGDCLDPAGTGSPFCDDAACCTAMCLLDAFCCDVEWDSVCAGNAATLPECAPPVDYDTCDSCLAVDAAGAAGDTSDNGSSGAAPSCGGGDSPDEWLCYTAGCTGTVTIDTFGSAYDTLLSVFSDCAGTEIACNDDAAGGGLQSEVTFAIVAGTVYNIRVGGFGTQAGVYALNIAEDCPVTCPAFPVCGDPAAGACGAANGSPGCDDLDCCCLVCTADAFCCDVEWDGVCAGAADAACGGPPTTNPDECEICDPLAPGDVVNGTTLDNTGSVDDTSCTTNDVIDEWYCYTATCNGVVTVSTCDQADFDTSLAAFDACNGLEVGCNDDGPGCGGFTSLLTFPVSAGVEYKIRVSGWNGDAGNYTLTLSEECSCNANCAADNVLTLNATACALNGGSVACSAGGNYTTDNGYAQSFDLSLGATAGLAQTVECVDIGVDANDEGIDGIGGGDYTINVNIYHDTNGGTPNDAPGDLTLVCGTTILVPFLTPATMFTASLAGMGCTLPANAMLVLEVDAPTRDPALGGDDGNFRMGSSGNPADGPSYLRSDACALVDYLDVGAIGFPDSQWVQNLGLNGPPPCGPGSGPCDVANGSPGCEDVACCEAICAADAFCCDVEWDGICAGEATDPNGPCVTLGACCQGVAGCFELTIEDCAAAGGTYQGDDTVCTPDPCPPVGACCGCPDVNACQVIIEADCLAIDGAVYLGDDTNCDLPPGDITVVDSGALFLDIPDGGAAPVTHDLNMGMDFAIGDVNIGVNVTHTWIGDVCVTISHLGVDVVIVQRIGDPVLDCIDGCCGSSDPNMTITLDDDATIPVDDAIPAIGTFIPDNPLSAFNGMSSAGVWTISVDDNAAQDTGTLDSWTLTISAPSTADPVCDAAQVCQTCNNGVIEGTETCDPGAADPSDCCDDVTCTFVPSGSNCGSGAGVCSAQDTCNATGTCEVNHSGAGTPCGSPGNECSGQDTCDGNGGCSLNDLPLGTACGNPADMPGVCFTGDACSGGGVCIPGTIVTSCIDDDLCCNRSHGCSDDNDNDCEADVPTVSTWGLLVLALLLAAAGKVYFGRRESVA